MEHTKEPWQYERIPAVFNPKMDGFQIIAATPDGNDVMTVALCTVGEDDEQNARRIVACVNACAGIPNSVLEEAQSDSWCAAAVNLVKQRDELLAALKKFLEDNDPEGFGCACVPGHLCGPCSVAKRQIPLRAAIAKVKGTEA